MKEALLQLVALGKELGYFQHTPVSPGASESSDHAEMSPSGSKPLQKDNNRMAREAALNIQGPGDSLKELVHLASQVHVDCNDATILGEGVYYIL